MNKWKEGDVIVKGTEKRVVDTKIEKWLIAPIIEGSRAIGGVDVLYTQEYLESNGWTKELPKVEPPIVELTVEELEAKLQMPKGTLRVKGEGT